MNFVSTITIYSIVYYELFFTDDIVINLTNCNYKEEYYQSFMILNNMSLSFYFIDNEKRININYKFEKYKPGYFFRIEFNNGDYYLQDLELNPINKKEI
jgi:hypothetical protein